jgi:hypothetical protein
VTELGPAAFVVTRLGGPTTQLALPPTIQKAVLDPTVGVDGAIEAHRRVIAQHGLGTPRLVRTLDDAVAVIDALHSHRNAWRAQQKPPELLDLDIRALLTERNEEVIRAMKRFMPKHK